jgi:hypothetical protein
VRAGLAAAGLWLLVEFGIRDVVFIAIFAPVVASGGTLDLRRSAIVSYVLLWPAMLVLGRVFLRLSRRKGFSWSTLGYHPWPSAILPGAIAAGIAWALIRLASCLTGLFGGGMVDEFVEQARAGGIYASDRSRKNSPGGVTFNRA